MNRNLWLLALCQGLFLTNNVAFIAMNGLVGLSLAPRSWLATLPIMAYVVGGAITTGLVARSQERWGRRGAFQIGLAVAVGSALLCALAVLMRNFWLLTLATLVAGYYNANANLYRFAAVELAAPAWREKAVSLVLAGGLIGAVAGPNLASQTRNLAATPFLGAYLSLAAVALLAMAILRFIDFPPQRPKHERLGGRPLREIMRQPAFIVAAAAGALGYGVMNLLMAATPIAMQSFKLPFDNVALVLELHVFGMFAPGFFTGHLIRRFGVLQIMGVGVLLDLGSIAMALSGVELHHFLVALFLLGIGWNFLFVGATTLSLTTYTDEERDRVQGTFNLYIFSTLAVTSFSSGVLVTTQGWQLLNFGSLILVALVAASLLWLAARPTPLPPLLVKS